MGLWLHPNGLGPSGEDHESENWALATDIEDLGFSNGDRNLGLHHRNADEDLSYYSIGETQALALEIGSRRFRL